MTETLVHRDRPARLGWLAVGALLCAVVVGPDTQLGTVGSVLVLALAIAVAVLGMARPVQTVLVDRRARTLIIRSASLFRKLERRIARADIASLDCVLVAGTGTEEHPSGYQLQATLASGEIVRLTRTYSGGGGLAGAIGGPPFEARNAIRDALGLETAQAG